MTELNLLDHSDRKELSLDVNGLNREQKGMRRLVEIQQYAASRVQNKVLLSSSVLQR